MNQLTRSSPRNPVRIPRNGSAVGSLSANPPVVSFASPGVKAVIEGQNLLQGFGFTLSLIYIFALFSVLSEISIELLGFKPYVTIIVGPLAMMACLLSGNLPRAFKTTTGRWFIALILWMAIGLPFSSWKGGSAAYLWDAFLKNYSIFFIITALAVSLRELRALCYVIALCGAVCVVVVARYGHSWDGRYSLAFGTLQNPNDLATHLLFAAPFVLFVFMDKPALRLIAGIVGLGMFFTVLGTGSRGGFLAFGGMVAFTMLRASATQRIAVVLIALMTLGGALVYLPSTSLMRLALITGDVNTADSYALDEAIGSTAARKHLLERSIELTFEHPVLGVGAGQFASAEAGEAVSSGMRAAWQVTHNTYTEFSSEDGIPALLMFIAAVVSSAFMNSRVYRYARRRPELQQVANMAFCLLSCTAGFMVSIFFASLAAKFYIPTLLGLSVALHLAVKPVFAQYAEAGAGVAIPGPFRLRPVTP